VLDARGMTRGIAPLILGYQAFDPDINIAGVILNQLGGSRHEAKLRNVIEHYTDVKVAGAIQHDDNFDIDERHLGLVPSHEDPVADSKVRLLAEAIKQQVDLDIIHGIADTAAPIDVVASIRSEPPQPDIRLGIVKSAAFGFYYADDLLMFRQLGAELIEIDVQNDCDLPALDALFIGGGFPETHMTELESNAVMRDQINQAIENGLPVYAECGGLMYLSRSISWRGRRCEMAGAIPGDIIMEAKPQGRGYVRLAISDDHPWGITAGETIYAHEFHYSRFENLDKDARFAFKVERGTGIDGDNDGYVRENLLASYTHQRSSNTNPWARRFIDFVRRVKTTRNRTI
jgi:cobyrinic acid a,c-diamide synthase